MNKSKKKNKKEQEVSFLRKNIVKIVIIFGVFVVSAGFLIYIRINNSEEIKPVVETPKSEVKKLPEEIKKKLSRATSSATFRVPILMYHYVEYVQDKKDTIRQALNINPYVFEQQVKTLSDAGYTFMTAKELGEVLDGKNQMPKNPILLTFDDGHWDFYTDVLPILKKYNAKATSYIITGFIGGSDFMNQEQIRGIIDSGLVDVGAHTVHHVSLKKQPLLRVQTEVADSKAMLENTFHIRVVSFAYPNGAFDMQAVQVLKDSGFSTAVSTVPGVDQNQNNRFFLYRLRPGGRTGQYLLNWLNQSSFRPYN